MSEEDRIHHSVGGQQANLLHTQPRNYDMDDSHDLQRWPKLAPVLYDCETALGEAFHEADASARIYETRYKYLAYSAAISLALVQLSLLMVEMPWWGRVGDFVAAIAAVGTVYALISRSQRLGFSDRRLLEREKAERCRFLKFQFLSDVRLWSGLTSQARQHWLRSRVEQLSTLSKVDLKSWAEEEKNEASEATSVEPAARLDEATLDQLIDYYYEKRLNYVINQVNSLADRNYLYSQVDWLARICSKSFTTLGLVAAVAYIFYNLSMPYSERDALSSALLFSSACLALVGETVNQFRKAKGFEHSFLRFRATSNELKRLADGLQSKADPQTKADLQAKLEIAHRIERVLHAERRANLISQIDPRFSESGG